MQRNVALVHVPIQDLEAEPFVVTMVFLRSSGAPFLHIFWPLKRLLKCI